MPFSAYGENWSTSIEYRESPAGPSRESFFYRIVSYIRLGLLKIYTGPIYDPARTDFPQESITLVTRAENLPWDQFPPVARLDYLESYGSTNYHVHIRVSREATSSFLVTEASEVTMTHVQMMLFKLHGWARSTCFNLDIISGLGAKRGRWYWIWRRASVCALHDGVSHGAWSCWLSTEEMQF